LGQVVDNRSIVNLPLNQRNPFALVFLVPGVVGSVGFNFNNSNIQINGGRPGSNEILADGIPSSPPLVNPIQGYSVFPSVDAVQEFKVQTDNYSAEFGRSGGGIINLVYKSGTNGLHGSLFEFLRNSKLDANDFFSNARGIPLASFKRNQFGGSGGGPVYLPRIYDGRNKTFFFFAWEGLRQGQAQNTITTVPTALQRIGNYSQTRNAAVLANPQRSRRSDHHLRSQHHHPVRYRVHPHAFRREHYPGGAARPGGRQYRKILPHAQWPRRYELRPEQLRRRRQRGDQYQSIRCEGGREPECWQSILRTLLAPHSDPGSPELLSDRCFACAGRVIPAAAL
jgi:hypothetical protein